MDPYTQHTGARAPRRAGDTGLPQFGVHGPGTFDCILTAMASTLLDAPGHGRALPVPFDDRADRYGRHPTRPL